MKCTKLILNGLICSLTSVSLYLLLLSPQSALSRESDPYMAASYDLEDSLPQVKNYMEEMFQNKLEEINSQAGHSDAQCLDVATSLMKVFRHTFYQKIEDFADHNLTVDKAPTREEMDDLEYIKASFLTFSPFNIALARTINLRGIYVGADKLGHFTSWGLRYLNIYRTERKKGRSDEEAQEAAIRYGRTSEYSILGKWSTKVASYGDMEANYQGMLFTLNLCETSSKFHLTQGDDRQWSIVGTLNLEDYINLDWDEIYNNSVFDQHFSNKVVRQTITRYCSLLKDQKFLDRYAKLEQVYQSSFNKKYLQQIDREKFGTDIQAKYSLRAYCQKIVK